MKLKDACSLEGKLWQTIQRIKKHRYHNWQKAWRAKARVFPVVMYGCESWTTKKLSAEELMLQNCSVEKTLESPLDCKEIKPVNPQGNQFWIFIGRTNAEAEAPVLWSPDAKNWLTGKDLDAGKDGRQEEKGVTENEMVGWHHWLNGHAFEYALGVGVDREAWRAAVHGFTELDTTEWLNWYWLTFTGLKYWEILLKNRHIRVCYFILKATMRLKNIL